MGKGASSAVKTHLEQSGLPIGSSFIGRQSASPRHDFESPNAGPVTPQAGYGSPYPGVSSSPQRGVAYGPSLGGSSLGGSSLGTGSLAYPPSDYQQNMPPPQQYGYIPGQYQSLPRSDQRNSVPIPSTGSRQYSVNPPPPPQQYGYGSPYPGVSSRPIYQPNQPRTGSPTIGIPGGIDPRTGMPNFGLGALNIPRYPVYQQPRNPYVRMPSYTPPAYSFPTPEQLWRKPVTTPVVEPTTPTTPTEPQQPDPGPPYSND